MTFSSRLAQRPPAPAPNQLAEDSINALVALGRILGELAERLNTADGDDRAAIEREMDLVMTQIDELV